jgi:hypothetical protein
MPRAARKDRVGAVEDSLRATSGRSSVIRQWQRSIDNCEVAPLLVPIPSSILDTSSSYVNHTDKADNKTLESVTPGFRFEVLPKKLDSRRQARCRDGARGNTDDRTGRGRGAQGLKKVAVQLLLLQMMRPRTGVQFSAAHGKENACFGHGDGYW